MLRREWAATFGLEYFTSPEFENSIRTIAEKIGVTEVTSHNVPNSKLLKGCAVLGYDAKPVPQNTGGKDHDCGYCGFGCPHGIKKSSLQTWIYESAKYGCSFLDGMKVERIIHHRNVAKGVFGICKGIAVEIKAKKVILSAGSLQSPSIILRSCFKNLNHHVGKHLRLHPVTMVYAKFPEEKVNPFEGSILTSVCNQVGNLDGKGYGAKIEVPMSHLGVYGIANAWSSAKEHKIEMAKYIHSSNLLILTRDKDSEGTIWVDSNGDTRLNWNFGSFDSNSSLEGIICGLKILIAAGACEVWTGQEGIQNHFKREPSISAEDVLKSRFFNDYLLQVRKKGVSTNFVDYFSAHQMGSCRMAADPKVGCVDPRGSLYGTQNVFICDGSVLPTASGVK
jgi:choline dehydrogenase-like flavoprotein